MKGIVNQLRTIENPASLLKKTMVPIVYELTKDFLLEWVF